MSWAKVSLFLVLVASLLGCSNTGAKDSVVVRNRAELQAVLQQAEAESEDALAKVQLGEPLGQLERDALIRSGDKFKAMINYDPRNWRLYLGALKIDLALDDLESARTTVGQVQPHVPQRPEIEGDRLSLAELYGDIARLHLLTNDYTKADLANEVARALVPTNVDYMATKASILIQQRKYAEAGKLLAKGIELAPSHKRLLALNKLLLMEEADGKKGS